MSNIPRIRLIMAGFVLLGAGGLGLRGLVHAHAPRPLFLAPGVVITVGVPKVAYNGQNSISAPSIPAQPHLIDPDVHVDITITNTGHAPFVYQPGDFTLVAQPGNVVHPYVADEGEVYFLGRDHTPLPGGVVMPGTSAQGSLIWALDDNPDQRAQTATGGLWLDNGWIRFTPFKTLALVYTPQSGHALALPLARSQSCAGSPKTRQWWTCTPMPR